MVRFRTPEEQKWEAKKHSFDIHYDPEDGRNNLHQNIGIHLQNYSVTTKMHTT
jgi:hypothetical protein